MSEQNEFSIVKSMRVLEATRHEDGEVVVRVGDQINGISWKDVIIRLTEDEAKKLGDFLLASSKGEAEVPAIEAAEAPLENPCVGRVPKSSMAAIHAACPECGLVYIDCDADCWDDAADMCVNCAADKAKNK